MHHAIGLISVYRNYAVLRRSRSWNFITQIFYRSSKAVKALLLNFELHFDSNCAYLSLTFRLTFDSRAVKLRKSYFLFGLSLFGLTYSLNKSDKMGDFIQLNVSNSCNDTISFEKKFPRDIKIVELKVSLKWIYVLFLPNKNHGKKHEWLINDRKQPTIDCYDDELVWCEFSKCNSLVFLSFQIFSFILIG